MPAPRVKSIALSAIFIALTAVATAWIVIPFPVSDGFFNTGEAVIYIAAIVFGPWVAGIGGGVGAMLGDLILGYTAWAPGTLVIKFLEGFVVGLVFRTLRRRFTDYGKEHGQGSFPHVLIIMVSAYLFSGGMFIVGYNFFPDALILWIIVTVVLIASITAASLLIEKHVVQILLAVFFGAAIMVTGYFLYTLLVYSNIDLPICLVRESLGWLAPDEACGPFMINYAAIWNIPWDMLQCTMGIAIAVPTIQILSKTPLGLQLQEQALQGRFKKSETN